jgi:hypothetical protein
MHSLPAIDDLTPPRFVRAVGIQLLALAAGMLLLALPWPRSRKAVEEPRKAEPKKEERRIRIVQLPTVAPKPPEPAPSAPKPLPSGPTTATARPAAAKTPPRPAEKPAQQALARIAADSTSVHGVRMRVLVPRSPDELARHLRNSGGCLVVSRLDGSGAEVLAALAIDGSRAVETGAPPCGGVPRLLRDPALNAALGDPLGRVGGGSSDVVLQVLLTPTLHESARLALLARFGAVSEEEMGRRAAETGYELTCFAEPAGRLRCE